ncbi:MAG TPA: hypothetical protein VE978_11675 [Chitinophagales bacterium]|nr:hypothetical protein [Chitinophagales bacterium]
MTIIILILAFFLIGVAIYYLDLMILKLAAKWFPGKFPAGTTKGLFVVRRLFRRRLFVAFLVVMAKFLLSLRYGKADFQWDIAYGLVEWASLMLGFYGAAWFLRFAPKRLNAALDYAERVESGETDVAEDLKNTVKRVNITAKISADTHQEKKAEKEIIPPVENTEKPAKDSSRISSKDLDESIDEFIKKR